MAAYAQERLLPLACASVSVSAAQRVQRTYRKPQRYGDGAMAMAMALFFCAEKDRRRLEKRLEKAIKNLRTVCVCVDFALACCIAFCILSTPLFAFFSTQKRCHRHSAAAYTPDIQSYRILSYPPSCCVYNAYTYTSSQGQATRQSASSRRIPKVPTRTRRSTASHECLPHRRRSQVPSNRSSKIYMFKYES